MQFILSSFAICLLTLSVAAAPSMPERPLRESDFSRAEECGKCHRDIYRQWSSSMHSRSFADPVYRAVFERMIAQTGRRNQIFCLSCHAPVATAAGTLLSLPSPLRWDQFSALAGEGVTCDFCHTIAANPKLSGRILIGGYEIASHGQAVKFGVTAGADDAPHPVLVSDILSGSAFCATCHSYKHPVLAAEIQNTYQEWRDSEFAREGIQCQDCHMPAVPVGNGETRATVASHAAHGGQGPLLERALRLDLNGEIEAGITPVLHVVAAVRNIEAGHRVPTGIPGIRELWLELEVNDGETALASGRFSLGQKLRDEKGAEALPWEAFALVEDLRIAPGQTVEKTLAVPLIPGVAPRLTVSARLRYLRVSETISRRLQLPVEEPRLLAVRTLEFKVN